MNAYFNVRKDRRNRRGERITGASKFSAAHFGNEPATQQNDSRRLLCSISRWQYSKAFSRKRSFGGSRRLEVEVTETMDTTELSSSDLSSTRTESHFSDGLEPFAPQISLN